MNIAVCLKQVPDTEGHIDVDRRSGMVHSPNLVMSPLDVLAVEEAVRIRERCGDGRVTAICMGPDEAQRELRQALSMGADDAVHVCDESLAGSDSYVTGLVLAKVLARSPYDLILCGRMAADTQAGQVGAVIAETLGMALVTSVVGIDIEAGSGGITAQRKIGGGKREVVLTAMPAVLTVDIGINKPRYPSLRAIKDAEKKRIEMVDLKALGMSSDEVGPEASLLQVAGVCAAKPSLKNLFVPDGSLPALDRINALMSGGIDAKKADVFVGGPKEAAARFAEFVKNHGLL